MPLPPDRNPAIARGCAGEQVRMHRLISPSTQSCIDAAQFSNLGVRCQCFACKWNSVSSTTLRTSLICNTFMRHGLRLVERLGARAVGRAFLPTCQAD
jgi:hypothetical protein